MSLISLPAFMGRIFGWKGVTELNKPPTAVTFLDGSTSVDAPEGSTQGTVFGTLKVSDPNIADTHVIEFADNNSPRGGRFNLSGHNLIAGTVPLVFGEGPYTINLKVTDSGGNVANFSVLAVVRQRTTNVYERGPDFFITGANVVPDWQFDVWAGRSINTLWGSPGGSDPIVWSAAAAQKQLYTIRAPVVPITNSTNVIAYIVSDEPSRLRPGTSGQPDYSNVTETPTQIQAKLDAWYSGLVVEQRKPIVINSYYPHLIDNAAQVSGVMRDYIEGSESSWAMVADRSRADNLPNLLTQNGFTATRVGHELARIRSYDAVKPMLAMVQAAKYDASGSGPTPGELRAQCWDAVISGACGVIYDTVQHSPAFSFDATDSATQIEITNFNTRIKALEDVLINKATGGAKSGTIFRSAPQGNVPNADQLPYPFTGRLVLYNGANYYVILNLSDVAATLNYAPWNITNLTFGPQECKNFGDAVTAEVWGYTSTNPIKKVGVDPLPTGVTIEEGDGPWGHWKWLHVNNTGVNLTDWDLRGYCLRVHAPNFTAKQILMDHGGPPRWGTWESRDFPPGIYIDENCPGWDVSHITMDALKVRPAAALGFGADKNSRGYLGYCKFLNLGSDGVFMGGGGVCEFVSISNIGYNWGGHVDGFWSPGVTSELVIQDCFIDDRIPADRGTEPAGVPVGGPNGGVWMKEELGHVRLFDTHIRRSTIRGGAMNIFIYPEGPGGGFNGPGSVYIYQCKFGDDSTFPPSATNGGWISDTDFGQPALPSTVHAQNNTRIDGSALGDRHPVGTIPTPSVDTTTPPPPPPPPPSGGSSINDYIPSVWAPTVSMSIPFSVPKKDTNVPTGIQVAISALKNPNGQQGITASGTGGEWYINQLGVYDSYDFRGRRVVLTFANSDPTKVVFKNCLFNNDYYTTVGYFASDITRGTILRSDCTFENCSFRFKSEAQGGGVGECVTNNKGLIHAYRCEFDGTVGDAFNIGGGDIYQCSFERTGNGNGVHNDMINWADNSIGPLRVKRCYFDGSIGTFPSPGGGFNSLVKLVPTSGPGPTHDLLFEENVCWFSAASNGEGNSTTNANNSWYWFQNSGGTGRYRFLNNYFGKLREDFQTLISVTPGSNYAFQGNKKLHASNAAWTGAQAETTAALAQPGALTISIAQTANTTIPTFSNPANTTFVEYEYRKIGDEQWLPRGVPIAITSGTTIQFGSGYEFHFRPVNLVSGRLVTGAWVNPNQSTTAPNTAPSFSVAPVISGVSNPPRVGETATVSYVAAGNPTPTATILWERADGTDIGTNSASYTIVGGDLAQGFKCTVGLSNGVNPPASLTTSTTAAVVAAPSGPTVGALGAFTSDQHHDGTDWDHNIVVPIPTHANGDSLFIPVYFGNYNDASAWTPPSGWTTVGQIDSFQPHATLITKQGNGTETSVTLTVTAATFDGLSNAMMAGRCWAVSGLATAGGQGFVSAVTNFPSTGAQAHTAVAALDNSIVFGVFVWAGPPTFPSANVPSGWTALFLSDAVNDTDTSRSVHIAVIYKAAASAGNVDPGVINLTAAPQNWTGFMGFYVK